MSDEVKRRILIGIGVVAFLAAGFFVWRFLRSTAVEQGPVTLMDSETGEIFHTALSMDMGSPPFKNPKTGQRTLYIPAKCWSPQCAEQGGTPVILNDQLGKPGPTRCPKCGRTVRAFATAPPASGSEAHSEDRGPVNDDNKQ